MNRAWKRQAAAAIAALVMIFAAVIGQSAAVFARHIIREQEQEPDQTREDERKSRIMWATIVQTAATHEGPGLRYPVTGAIRAGIAVEVVRHMDGWCKCLTYLSAEPVWICGEYVVLSD